MADQFHRDRVHAGATGVLTPGKRGERARVPARQIPADVGNLRGDQMKVVEQPVSRRHHELTGADIVGERAIGLAKHADVVVESRKRVSCAPVRVGIDGQARRQGQRTVFEPLDVEEFVPERLLDCREPGPLPPWAGQSHEANRVSGATW